MSVDRLREMGDIVPRRYDSRAVAENSSFLVMAGQVYPKKAHSVRMSNGNEQS